LFPSEKRGGRDVAKASIILLPVVLASTIVSAQVLGATSGPEPSLKTPLLGSSLTCSQPQPHAVHVPRAILERSKLKAKLLNLLHDSLYDDENGIVNVKREEEIRKLANKLKNDRD
jgi:hypothetical protein